MSFYSQLTHIYYPLEKESVGKLLCSFHLAPNQLFHEVFCLIDIASIRVSWKVGFHSKKNLETMGMKLALNSSLDPKKGK